MILIENLYKIYKMGDSEVHALDGVSLHIRPHEFVAIIGPSGSGKSTLMNMIGCLDVPTSGKYFLNGQDVSNLTDDQQATIRNKTIGFIFQQYNLLPKLSARENVELPLIYRGVPADERRELAMNALKRVGMAERAEHMPKELSGGQQQRVSIARALAGKPPLILADEPTGALDSRTGAELMVMLKELHEEGNTIVLITHDSNIARQAKRVVRIQDGKITDDKDADSEVVCE